MKTVNIISVILYSVVVLLSLPGCGKDNYDIPQSRLLGKITYNGQSVGLKGTNEAVQLQLYQDGYDKKEPIPVYAAQDGTFDAMLFDGTYKLVTRNNNGPWVNTRDTLVVNVKGSTTCEVKVTPFFTVNDVSISLDNQTVTARCIVDKVVDNAKIAKVMLLLNKTVFVDEESYIASQNRTDFATGELVFTFDISKNQDIQSAHTLFARIGVKASGAAQAIYSDVKRLK